MPTASSNPRRGRRFRFVLLLGAAVVGAAACSRLHPEEEVEVQPAMVVFENQSLEQADVFVIRSGSDSRRIGTVMAGRTDTLEVPRDLIIAGTVNIVARLLARSNRPQTGPVSIGSGDWFRVTLPMDGRTLAVLGLPR